jgi:hypothetical protein
VKAIDAGLAGKWTPIQPVTDLCHRYERTLGSSEDAYVSLWANPYTCYGDSIQLIVGDAAYGAGDVARTYVLFDLGPPNIPYGAVLEQATLLLNCIGVFPGGSTDYVIDARPLHPDTIGIWNEHSICGDNAPPPAVDILSSTSPALGWCSWNVIDGIPSGPDHGDVTFVLTNGYPPGEGEPHYAAEFCSKEWPNPFLHPDLEVIYVTWDDSTLAVDAPVMPPATSVASGRLLEANYPNPFHPSTRLRYTVPAGAGRQRVRLSVYDISGRLVRHLVDEPQEAGNYTVAWHGRDQSERPVASGVFFYRLQWNGLSESRKMLLLK